MSLKKRSLTLHGHRTSLALEPDFWAALEDMAAREGASLASVIARIDDKREADAPLSSAVRVAVLRHFVKAGSEGQARQARAG
ncbi:ribbon-helix-helix domain-containing protein [Stappia sp. F7233]|uniref:Ribbon-helix-helix domain-containing protein n=1 Tax=Stappia albiluteola TaxID=2758565 RepID=A0A839ADD0_9HYPH|nr:ribbon-helix-helix domain-containing protein [Stappia albiluteola]MBA5777780.1 ribbon-helix-helix domain-containing protein [Stappia albiluteola]